MLHARELFRENIKEKTRVEQLLESSDRGLTLFHHLDLLLHFHLRSALWKDTFGGKESTDRKNLEEGSVEGGSPSPPPRSKSKGRSSASKPSSSRRPREIRGKKDSDNEEEEEEEAEEEEIEDSRESSYAATRENSRPRAWRDSRFDAPSSSRPGSSASFRSLSSSSSYSQPNQHHSLSTLYSTSYLLNFLSSRSLNGLFLSSTLLLLSHFSTLQSLSKPPITITFCLSLAPNHLFFFKYSPHSMPSTQSLEAYLP